MNLLVTSDERVCIDVAIDNASDRRLIAGILAERGYVLRNLATHNASLDGARLLIVDAVSHRRLHERIRQVRQQRAPVLLPVLVLAGRVDTSLQNIETVMSDTADDLLRLPTTGAELAARVQNLIRMSEFSSQQHHEYRLLREVLAREDSEDEFCQRACDLITEFKGYGLACFGLVEPDETSDAATKKCRIAGVAGRCRDAFGVASDNPVPAGLVAQALAGDETQVFDKIAHMPEDTPWREAFRVSGLASLIMIPVRPRRGQPALLVLCTSRPEAFRAEEQRLLERYATHLVFGLERVRMQSERERQQAEINRLAHVDPLTELPNRRYLANRLQELVVADAVDHRFAVLFLDLDDFKLINDGLGHAAGDQILKQVAARIQHSLRNGDLVGRHGGDEFIVVMRHEPREPLPEGEDHRQSLMEAAGSLANRIIDALRHPFAVEGEMHRLGASIGISLYPDSAVDTDTVLDQADTAMYQAKRTDRRVMFHSVELERSRQHRFSMETRLHQALDKEELELHYQPLWEVDSARMVGVEALMRWTDSEGNRISPAEFIPMAEDLRLMVPLSEWMMDRAARDLIEWQDRGLALFMSINLSITQFQEARTAQRIRDFLLAYGTAPDRWMLEVTEDSILHEPERVEGVMAALRDDGFHLALDDFGRGYSSLERLQRLPVDTLKIDKLFVKALGGSESGSPIVRSIIDLAGHLGLFTLAEGVETAEQREQLAALGCRWGQGFWYSPAIPAADILELAARARCPRT